MCKVPRRLKVRDNLSRRAQLKSGRKDLIPVGGVQVLAASGQGSNWLAVSIFGRHQVFSIIAKVESLVFYSTLFE